MKKFVISLSILAFLFSFVSCNHFENEEDGFTITIKTEEKKSFIIDEPTQTVNIPSGQFDPFDDLNKNCICAILDSSYGPKYKSIIPFPIEPNDDSDTDEFVLDIEFPKINYKYTYDLYILLIQDGLIYKYYEQKDLKFKKDTFYNIIESNFSDFIPNPEDNNDFYPIINFIADLSHSNQDENTNYSFCINNVIRSERENVSLNTIYTLNLYKDDIDKSNLKYNYQVWLVDETTGKSSNIELYKIANSEGGIPIFKYNFTLPHTGNYTLYFKAYVNEYLYRLQNYQLNLCEQQ